MTLPLLHNDCLYHRSSWFSLQCFLNWWLVFTTLIHVFYLMKDLSKIRGGIIFSATGASSESWDPSCRGRHRSIRHHRIHQNHKQLVPSASCASLSQSYGPSPVFFCFFFLIGPFLNVWCSHYTAGFRKSVRGSKNSHPAFFKSENAFKSVTVDHKVVKL